MDIVNETETDIQRGKYSIGRHTGKQAAGRDTID